MNELLSKLFGKHKKDDLGYTPDEKKIFAASKTIGWAVVGCGLGGIIIIAMWAQGVNAPREGSPAVGFSAFLGADLLVAAAAAGVGGLLGFVFGIPRTLDPASRAAVATAATLSPAAASQAVMAANTNLERISDWLTTLLVGATLVQIKDIAGWVGSLGKSLIGTGPAANDAVVPIIVIYFFAVSFLGVYLITRLYLTFAFRQMILTEVAPSAPVDKLKQQLDAAIKSGKAEDLTAAMAAYMAEAIRRTKEAIEHGKQGHADVLVTHAQAALQHAEAAEKAKDNSHTKEGITHLNAAIDHGKQGHADVATTDAQEALTHLEAATQ